jgi:hypothetical protein
MGYTNRTGIYESMYSQCMTVESQNRRQSVQIVMAIIIIIHNLTRLHTGSKNDLLKLNFTCDNINLVCIRLYLINRTVLSNKIIHGRRGHSLRTSIHRLSQRHPRQSPYPSSGPGCTYGRCVSLGDTADQPMFLRYPATDLPNLHFTLSSSQRTRFTRQYVFSLTTICI